MTATATADPILALVRDLDDATKFVRVRNVPVCRPHRRTETKPDGTKIEVEFTAANLPDMAEEVNRAWRETGDPIRVTVGHVHQEPGYPEQYQPELVGFAKDARAGTFGPGKVPGLLCNLYVRRGRESVLKQYPFRSMELDPDTQRIHGIALLVRSPWLDLGALHYSAGRWLVHYEGQAMDPTIGGGMPGGDAGGGGMPEMGGGEPEEFTPEDEAQYAKFVKYMKKYQADGGGGMAAMGAGNAALPAPGPGPTPQPMPYQKDPNYLRVSRERDQAKAERAAAHGRMVAEYSARLLDPLVPKIVFDYQLEHARLVGFATDAERVQHVQYMDATHERLPSDPGHGMLPIAPAAPSSGSYGQGGLNNPMAVPTGYERTMQYLLANPGISYEKAEAHVRTQR